MSLLKNVKQLQEIKFLIFFQCTDFFCRASIYSLTATANELKMQEWL